MTTTPSNNTANNTNCTKTSCATAIQSSYEIRSGSNLMMLVQHKWRKMWKRDSADITPIDPTHKVVYLGNVVTTWAKGEGCLERPASALWRNHCQGRGSIKMALTVSPSGLKAQTREHGLTEYWANRLTWCGVPSDYPKLFCWIYRHEGRKLKQELRCHAVLCSKEERAIFLTNTLRNRLAEALFDFRKEKILRQNARLSIVQNLYNTSATKRKLVLLNSNSHNYKPPLERSKSAPKLSCIEEYEEDENEENEETSCPGVKPASPYTNGNVLRERLSTPIEEVDEEEGGDDDELISRVPGSPSSVRRSCPEPVVQAHLATRNIRPHTVPMDAKLNLPFLTGYDKVMHMLDMPCESRGGEPHLLDEEDEEYSYPYVATNSDPVASSPNSDASESVVDTGSEDEFGKRSQREDSGQEEDRESDENEINDNVSDESGYSEEAVLASHRKDSQGVISSRTKQRASDDGCTKSKRSPQAKNNNNNNNNNAVGSDEPKMITSSTPTSPTLVIYDNLCFEI
ncbi:Protein FAM43A [Orchesella cincta]|uniref:Protein FAM43A n=1 Tax=Orchesella cincta TaxID=48709 RepID=A0A1D2NKZ4_ORCCI|nr:Protein FAM43A [Orchesella cincta]